VATVVSLTWDRKSMTGGEHGEAPWLCTSQKLTGREGQRTIYGFAPVVRLKRGEVLEVHVTAAEQVRIELLSGAADPTDHDWVSKHATVAVSAAWESHDVSFEPGEGEYTVFIARYAGVGEAPQPVTLKEVLILKKKG